MKIWHAFLPLLLVAMLATGCCSSLVQLGKDVRNVKAITPSDVIITEERAVSGFAGIDMRTFGKVVLTQGDSESLTISGSDNVVPLVTTSVQSGILIIEMVEKVNILTAQKNNVLTCTITVKDLTALTISGAAEVEMESLTTSGLAVTMSGAGQVRLGQLAASSVDIRVSGLGNVDIAGQVARANITISGAGNVSASDLKCQTADITIPGLGNATVWVTDQLTGTISGGGSVSYYGAPQTNTKTTGLGSFKALGNK